MLLIRPKVGKDWLGFESTPANISAGYLAAQKALEHLDSYLDQPGGIFPRRRVELDVLQDRCIGCGLGSGRGGGGSGQQPIHEARGAARLSLIRVDPESVFIAIYEVD